MGQRRHTCCSVDRRSRWRSRHRLSGAPATEFSEPQHPVAPIVSPRIAQDVRQDFLIELAWHVAQLKLTNVVFALGKPHDPRLPAASLDAAILVHMYHEIAQPYAFLYNLAPTLKLGAWIEIVDLERPTEQHGAPIELLRCDQPSAIARSARIS
jgi:hypothetical protein